MEMTTAGLPNTCSRCGHECRDWWWAAGQQAALAGLGLCAECAVLAKRPAGEAGSVKALGLSQALTDLLCEEGIETIEALEEMSDKALLGIKGIGPVTLRIIRDQIRSAKAR